MSEFTSDNTAPKSDGKAGGRLDDLRQVLGIEHGMIMQRVMLLFVDKEPAGLFPVISAAFDRLVTIVPSRLLAPTTMAPVPVLE